MKDPDGVGRVGNPLCGDVIELYIKVDNDRIVEAKFKTFGCGAAIAISSMITELIKGKTIEESLQVSSMRNCRSAGRPAANRDALLLLAQDALARALEDYRGRGREQQKTTTG